MVAKAESQNEIVGNEILLYVDTLFPLKFAPFKIRAFYFRASNFRAPFDFAPL